MKDMIIFHKLSALFDYPGNDYFEQMSETEGLIRQSYTIHYLSWLNYTRMVQSIKLDNLQEQFISYFDVKASSTLDVGHVLFGEDKKRNNFMIHLKEEYAKVNHDCGKEMPDYLSNLLSLMAFSKDTVFIEELAVSIILPALRLMNSGLGNEGNPYVRLFGLLIEIIEKKYPDSDYKEYVPVAKTTCNFSKSHCHHG